jgi:hypothetical protein
VDRRLDDANRLCFNTCVMSLLNTLIKCSCWLRFYRSWWKMPSDYPKISASQKGALVVCHVLGEIELGTCVMLDLKVRLVLMSLFAKCSRDTRLIHPFIFEVPGMNQKS